MIRDVYTGFRYIRFFFIPDPDLQLMDGNKRYATVGTTFTYLLNMVWTGKKTGNRAPKIRDCCGVSASVPVPRGLVVKG